MSRERSSAQQAMRLGEGDEAMSRAAVAESRFRSGFLCSQAVLSAFAPDLGMDVETALKLGAPFGGGVAGMGEMCGAVTGACMAIGLRHGRTKADDQESEDRTNALVREFVVAFKERHGSIVCRELLGCDISTPEGGRLARASNLFGTLCSAFVSDAAKIVEPLLEADAACSQIERAAEAGD